VNGRKERQILRPVPSGTSHNKVTIKETPAVSIDEKAFVSHLHKMQINEMMTRTQVRSAKIVKQPESKTVSMVFFADPDRSKQISKWFNPSPKLTCPSVP